ncbi:MAG: hypothetical protein MJ154_03620 [Candidatus Saccharibacteria bacterium]|nr:hypothetical protein [Candidatus Saccharibacteria bacterium]
MDNNNLDNQNSPEQNEQDNVPMLDKIIQNNPFVKMGPENYQNVQTQSVVMSTREEADQQLAAINAQNAEYMRQQKLAEETTKVEKTGLYIFVAIIFIAIIGTGGWLVFNAMMAGRQTVTPEEIAKPEEEAKKEVIQGYKCTTTKCEKMADIDSKTILIRDSDKFYTFKTDTKTKSLTTIPPNEYHEIKPFKWGGSHLAILDPESGQSALYSITTNRQITEFAYDDFYTDIKSDTYKEMRSIDSSYIIARNGSSQRLIDLSSGQEKVRAAKKVFTHDNYYFGYENDGTIHIYDSLGAQFAVAAATDYVFTKGGYVIILNNKATATAYDSTGKKATNIDIIKAINKINSKTRINTILNDKTFYHIAANN